MSDESPQKEAAVSDGHVPEKQIYRWKDDGGALPPEPDQPPDRR